MTTDSRASIDRWTRWVTSSWVLAAVTLFVYSSSLNAIYVFDDFGIFESEAYSDFWAMEWWSWKERPVGRFSFAAQIAIFGTSSFWSHVINVLIHVAAVLGLRELIDHLFQLVAAAIASDRVRLVSWTCALLWGVHPITTAAVTYTVQRYESLAACLMIWSCLFWTKHVISLSQESDKAEDQRSPSLRNYLLSLALAALAMGTKETAAALPICFLWLLFLARPKRNTVVAMAGPLVLLSIVGLGLSLRFPSLLKPDNRTGTIGFDLHGISAIEYIATQPIVYLRYAKLLVWPSDLVLDYGWIPSLFSSWFWLGIGLWFALFGTLLTASIIRPSIGWALTSAWLLLAVTSLIPTQDMIFEHRMYLPSAILLSCLAAPILLRFSSARVFSLSVVALLAVLLSYVTILRNTDYYSAEALAAKDLQRVPDNPRNYARWGAEVADDRDPRQLEDTLKKAIAMAKQRGYFHAGLAFAWRLGLADLLFLRGEFEEAKVVYAEALPESHDDHQRSQVLLPLAVMASLENRFEEAEDYFQEALAKETLMSRQVEDAYETHRSRWKAQQSDRTNSSMNRSGIKDAAG